MYQICNHVKELIILTIPMDNQIHFFQELKNNVPNEEYFQKKIKLP